MVSDSVQPHKWKPTRLPRPWDSPSKTRVGCHFLLQCMKVKIESEVAQSCPTLSDPMDYSLPGSSIHGIFQARVLEWGAIAFSETTYGWELLMWLCPETATNFNGDVHTGHPTLWHPTCYWTSQSITIQQFKNYLYMIYNYRVQKKTYTFSWIIILQKGVISQTLGISV